MDVTITMPQGAVDKLDAFVEDDEFFENRSEAVRYAVRNMMQRIECEQVTSA